LKQICLKKYCSKLSKDFNLVQGAGGNISWKQDRKILFIKASGMHIGRALKDDIFVQVNYEDLIKKINCKNWDENINATFKSKLKPSIETMMHAIIPYKYVFHLHIISVLSILIRVDANILIKKIISNNIGYEFIDYHKPGVELAKAIFKAKSKHKVFFLKNHGLIFASDTLKEIKDLINRVVGLFSSEMNITIRSNKFHNKTAYPNYSLIKYESVNQLAFNSQMLKFINFNWALYPDHIVFLGPYPLYFKSSAEALEHLKIKSTDYLIIKNEGVFVRNDASENISTQLRAFYELLTLIDYKSSFYNFKENEINELINWDAELYRKSIL